MQILPVLDILDGVIVRGIGGRRSDYRPIVSQLTSSHEPLAVANAIRNEFGLTQFYVADLDGIQKQRPNVSIYRRLIADDFRLLIDPGIREPDEACLIQELGAAEAIVGLETCPTPEHLRRIVASAPDIAFSLDLFQGVPRTGRPSSSARRPDPEVGCWSNDPEETVRQIVNSNVTSIIILDLSDVGMGTGGSTDSLCHFVRNEFPNVRLIVGGGVRGRADLQRLSDLGVDAVLVASALHDGRLGREDIPSS